MTEKERCEIMFGHVMEGASHMRDDTGYAIIAKHLAEAAKDNIAFCEAALSEQ